MRAACALKLADAAIEHLAANICMHNFTSSAHPLFARLLTLARR